ncbi:hypothetical protein BDV93DRAFT_553991 [Ceratobasidium sp. AG-I]|nr:hypothetical protein BDV93DRAFT_553991 [Ceratobasidium sp. AG-I]
MTSRLLRPSSIWSHGSSNWSLDASIEKKTQSPISFEQDWDSKADEIFAWYNQLPCTKFATIQYRKEYKSPFYHEFLCAKLTDGDLCRLERFGDPRARTDALTKHGSMAHDFAEVYPGDYLETLDEGSKVLLEVTFLQEVDLMDVLKICYSIQQDSRTRSYTLPRYNCYFFCWCVLTILTREAVSRNNTPTQETPPSYPAPPEYKSECPTYPLEHPIIPIHDAPPFLATYPMQEHSEAPKHETGMWEAFEMGMDFGKGVGKGAREGAKEGIERGRQIGKEMESRRARAKAMTKGMAKGMARGIYSEMKQTKVGKWLEAEARSFDFEDFIQSCINDHGSRVELVRLGEASVVRSEVMVAIEEVWQAMLTGSTV